MISFGNVMYFVLVKTEMEYLKHIQSYRILFNLFIFLAKSGIQIQLHLFWLKQVIWKNALLDLIRATFIRMAITQLIMGLSEKFFHLNDP